MAKKPYKPTVSEVAESAVAAVYSVTGPTPGTRKRPSVSKPSLRAPKSAARTSDKNNKSGNSFEPLWDLHIKHPPSQLFPFLRKGNLDKLPSLYRDGPVDAWGRIPLDDIHIAYKTHGNPLLVLEAFVLAHKEKLYPPLWVLDILNHAFEKLLSDKGLSSLDELLHLMVPSKRTSVFKETATRRRNFLLATRICLYSTLKPCSIDMACQKVAAHWNASIDKGVRHFGYKLDVPFKCDVLRQNYCRTWRREFMCDESFSSVQQRLHAMSDKERADFLAEFDKHHYYEQ
jgi:hypothetical protein